MPIGTLHNRSLPLFLLCLPSIFAHESLSVTVLLKTGAPGLLSGSTQKYPRRSNCTRTRREFRQSGFDLRGHDTHGVGVQQIRELHAFGRIAGRRGRKQVLVQAHFGGYGVGHGTQWMVPLILRPSGVAPPFDSGS